MADGTSLPQEFSTLRDMRNREGSVPTEEFMRTIRAHVHHGVPIDVDAADDLVFEFDLEPLSKKERAEVVSLGIEHATKAMALASKTGTFPDDSGLRLSRLMISHWDREEPLHENGRIELRVDSGVLGAINTQRDIASLESLVETCRQQVFLPENVLYAHGRSTGERWQQVGAQSVILIQYLQAKPSSGLEGAKISPLS